MKFKLFTLILLFLTAANTSLFSQPTIVNQKTIGGNQHDILNDICVTNDGGVLVGGYSSSRKSGEKTKDCFNSTDYWIVKLNNKNKIEWDKTIGGKGYDALTCLQQTKDGGYILGGYSESKISGNKSEDPRGKVDYWIVKTDSLGNIQWDKTIGGSNNDFLYALQQTFDGGYILGGFSESNKSGNKSENSRGDADYWVVKTDSAGNVQWDKTIGGANTDILYALHQTSDGGYILAGYSASGISYDKTQANNGGIDIWVVKLNPSGKIIWDKGYGGIRDEYANTIQQTSDAGFIIGGSRNSAGRKQDYWVIKTDNSGSIEWDKAIGGDGDDQFYSLDKTTDGGYIVSGYSSSGISGQKTEPSRGAEDYWMVKLNEKGKYEWDKTIGGVYGEYEAVKVREIAKNHYVVGGSSLSPISGDKTDTSRGGFDYWIVYLNYTKPAFTTHNSITVTNQNLSSNSSVYPNPAKNVLNVHTNIKATFTLTDQSGKTILTKVLDGYGTINVSNFTPGIYYLKNNETGKAQKIIIAE